jgi:hypothetical protein
VSFGVGLPPTPWVFLQEWARALGSGGCVIPELGIGKECARRFVGSSCGVARFAFCSAFGEFHHRVRRGHGEKRNGGKVDAWASWGAACCAPTKSLRISEYGDVNTKINTCQLVLFTWCRFELTVGSIRGCRRSTDPRKLLGYEARKEKTPAGCRRYRWWYRFGN